MKKKKKQVKEENCFVEMFKELSFTIIAQAIFSIIWNVILFIPRSIIRLYNNMSL